KNKLSAITPSQNAVLPPIKKAAREIAHKMEMAANPFPFKGLIFVQFALAVNRKPTAIVAINAQSISCACQLKPSKGAGITCGAKIQIAIETSAHKHPAM